MSENILLQEIRNRSGQELLKKIQQELRVQIKGNDDVEFLHVVLQNQVENQKWENISLIVWAIEYFPDRRFTPVLCELLKQRWNDDYLEAIADVLFTLKDENSIPCIIDSIGYYIPGDDDYHFSRKLVLALGHIGTQQAIDGLEQAVQCSESELVRKLALHELQKLKNSA